ncbi:MAG: alternative oxidase [Acidimicrobiales bacterium]
MSTSTAPDLASSPPPAGGATVTALTECPRPDLGAAQRRTLDSPRLSYGLVSRALFTTLDLVYGRERSLEKFRVLELLARVPYQCWERVGYAAVGHMSRQPAFARRVFRRVEESRGQQDNEQWHLLIVEELLWQAGARQGVLRHRLLPHLVGFAYSKVSCALYVLRPASSYRLNAEFEDHAEHEYMHFVAEHPELEEVPFTTAVAAEYGRFHSLADVLRQIGVDERAHKEASLADLAAPRFR